MPHETRKIVVAISGASGAIYAAQFLKKMQSLQAQYHTLAMVMSKNAKDVWMHELDEPSYQKLPFKCYDINDYFAPFASGSGGFDTMVIIPCSMGTVAKIASGVSSDLTTRAADVMLKERKKLICVVRETPYNLIQLENLTTLTRAGAIICPASPSFYAKPATIEDVVATVVDRVLDLCGISIKTFRWGATP